MILSDFLWKSYQEKSDEVAIILIQSGQPDQPITYRQIFEGASAVVEQLRRRGAQPGDIVILILQHSLELIHTYLGIILLGAIPSIMPFLTEKLQPERYRTDLSALIKVTRPAFMITYADFESEVRSALKPGDSVRAVLLASDLLIPASGFSPPRTNRSPEDIAILQHSSGTTGLQKGVALSHQSIINQLESYQKALSFTSADVVVSWLPLYHDMGLIAGFLMPVLLGARLILMSPFDWVRAPVKLLQAVSRYQGTLTWLPNFAFNFCAQKIREREMDGVDLSTWRGIINCSEPMRWESQNAFLQRFSRLGLKESAIATSYAMAENVFAVTQGGINKPLTVEAIDRDLLQSENIARPATSGDSSILFMLSAGQPIDHVEICVLDTKHQPLPDRYVGEIAIKSNCMLNGYYNRPELTSQVFYWGWYLTGDLGYLVNGELFITGRKKDIIIVGGKNIYPQDLELLAMEVPGVHMGRVSAFGVFNDRTGTEDVVIVAEVDTQGPELREQIEDNIRVVVSRGSAVTLRNVYLVDRHWLVKTSSGKTARSANRDKYIKELGESS